MTRAHIKRMLDEDDVRVAMLDGDSRGSPWTRIAAWLALMVSLATAYVVATDKLEASRAYDMQHPPEVLGTH